VSNHSEAFVAFDSAKLRNSVAIAEAGRGGEVRFFGEIENSGAATAKLVKKLAAKYQRLTFCYEAGPTGYGLYRQIKSLDHECIVVAPSLIPKRPGDKVKTNRRDAVSLAKLLRAGELSAVWVPDRPHEAMRDLIRAREAAVMDLRCKRQQVSAFLLRQGLHYPGKKTWTKTHISWLASQKLEYPEQRIALEEMMLAVRQAQARLLRLEQAIRDAVPDWSLAEVVPALMAMRGIDLTRGGDIAGRDRRPLALPNAPAADGLSRPGAVGGFDGRHDQARSHHQGRQPPRPPHPGGMLLELSASPPGWTRQAAEG
jgi:transposase